jgi:hypothetical protein
VSYDGRRGCRNRRGEANYQFGHTLVLAESIQAEKLSLASGHKPYAPAKKMSGNRRRVVSWPGVADPLPAKATPMGARVLSRSRAPWPCLASPVARPRRGVRKPGPCRRARHGPLGEGGGRWGGRWWAKRSRMFSRTWLCEADNRDTPSAPFDQFNDAGKEPRLVIRSQSANRY